MIFTFYNLLNSSYNETLFIIFDVSQLNRVAHLSGMMENLGTNIFCFISYFAATLLQQVIKPFVLGLTSLVPRPLSAFFTCRKKTREGLVSKVT